MLERVRAGVRSVAPSASVVVVASAPIVGSVLLGLDALGGDGTAASRAGAVLEGAAPAARRRSDG